MPFIRPVDVGELAAGDPVKHPLALRPEVEKLLGVTVHVHRTELLDRPLVIDISVTAVAVGGTARCVEKTDSPPETELRNFPRRIEVVVDQIGGVALGRRGTGPHVDHPFDLRRIEPSLRQPLPEHVLLQVIPETKWRQVLPLVGSPEVVHHQDVFDAAPVQAPDDGTADQTGPACHDIHENSSSPPAPGNQNPNPCRWKRSFASLRTAFCPCCSGPERPVR